MFEKVFGSKIDWISQHSVFPDYFRQLFYETGDLFPEFALHIGGGQNIYNFAYYGLYNPLVLPSYFLPFMKMSDYLIAVSIICLILDGVLMFHWLKNNGISKYLCTGVTMLFLLASPLIFHSYTHIMFVNYMPFLVLGLIGIDRYFEKQKAGLLTFCIFLMIMTSFYFSIGGCIVLGIYGLYKYWGVSEKNGNLKIRSMLIDGIKFCIPFLVGICMSGVLLIPTAIALQKCERQVGEAVTFPELFLPDLKWDHLFYSPYGIGMTTLVLTMLLTGITLKKAREKYIYSVCLIIIMIPTFRFVLNGGLYIRGKVLIPMLPLLCYLLALYLQKIKKHEIPFIQLLIPSIVTILLIGLGFKEEKQQLFTILLLADASLMFLCVLFFHKKACEKIMLCISIGLLVLCGIKENVLSDDLAERDFYQKVTGDGYKKLSQKILNQENGFYRIEESGSMKEDAANINRVLADRQYLSSIYSSTYHVGYQNFRKNTFQLEQPNRNILMQAMPKNPVFQKVMGIKYIISEKDVPGYEKISDYICVSHEVYPIAYVTNHLIEQDEYEKLQFPYNQLAFLRYAVSEKAKSPHNWKKELENCVEILNIGLEKKKVNLNQSVSEEISIPKAKKGDIFFLQFDVVNEQPDKDIAIYLEGVRNKLSAQNHLYYNENETFTYAIALEEGQTRLELQFGSGTYDIQNVKSFLYRNKSELEYTEFKVDHELTKGNKIIGSIEGKENGYLITSIPYDENFEIRVDGKRVELEKVNTTFLGTKIKEGNHMIELTYHAKGLKSGLLLSALGWALFVWILISQGVIIRRHLATLNVHGSFRGQT